MFACGEGSALSGRAAAHLLGLIRGRPAPDPEVTGPTERNIPGIATHRARGGLAPDWMRFRGIPVTTPARTLVDLAASADDGELSRAVHEATIRFDLAPEQIDAVLELRKHALPLPETNRLAGGRVVDCRWPAHALTVELDGYRFHRSRHAWERDRLREREAYRRGDHFRRYTWGDVVERESQTLSEILALFRVVRTSV